MYGYKKEQSTPLEGSDGTQDTTYHSSISGVARASDFFPLLFFYGFLFFFKLLYPAKGLKSEMGLTGRGYGRKYV